MPKLHLAILFCLTNILLISCGGKKEETTALDSAKLDINLAPPTMIVSIGRIEPENKIIKLASEVSGIAKKIYFQAGDSVKKGDVILELTNDFEQAQLNVIKSQLQTKQSDITAAKANLEGTIIKTDNLKLKYERLKNSFEKGAETKQNLDNAFTEYSTSQKEVERLTANLSVIKNQVQEIYQLMNVNTVQLNRKFIKAPSDGIILSMDITPGSSIQALSSIADFAPVCPISVVCEVDELFAANINVGDSAYVRYAGQTERIGVGTIIFASPYLKKKSLFSDVSSDMEDRRVREVRVRLSKTNSLLFGSRVECVIIK